MIPTASPHAPFEARFHSPGVDLTAIRELLGLLAETIRNWDRPVVLWCRSTLNEALLTEFPHVRPYILGIVDPDGDPAPFHGVPAIDPAAAPEAGLAFIGTLSPRGPANEMLVKAAGLAHPRASVWTLKEFRTHWANNLSALKRVMERKQLPLAPHPIVITAPGSCGMNWSLQVLATAGLMPIPYDEVRRTGTVAQLQAVKPGQIVADHLVFDRDAAALPDDAKLVVCIRDPRDTIVSSYHYFVEVKKTVTASFDDFFVDTLNTIEAEYEDMALKWMTLPGALVVRYEDVVRNEGDTARRLLRYAEVPLPGWLRNLVVTRSSFKVLTGRERGQTAGGQWLRRGGIGYYRETFSEAQLRQYTERCGALHRALGYSFDDDGGAS